MTDVFVKVGDTVTKDQPLFKLDDRALQAQLTVDKATLASAKEKLAKLVDSPRPEDVPPAVARVSKAQASLADVKDQLDMYHKLPDIRAVSVDEVNRRRYAVDVAQARLEQAQTALDELKAGTWKPDVKIAQADVDLAQAQLLATQIDINRLTVTAPVRGQLLQVKIHPGEYATTGVLATPLMLLGDTDTLAVRVDIDENDVPRFDPTASAVAYVRGDSSRTHVDLQFMRLEPYVIPKVSLTGDPSERTDTRVLQVLYSFRHDRLPSVHPGQQMDVYVSNGLGSSVPSAAPAK